MERTDRIPLAPTERRCEPAKPCTVRSRCARGIAALPKHGAILTDHSGDPFGGTVMCPGFLAAASIRKEAMAREVKPWPKGED